MGKPLRVLIVEDSENDALLVERELERGGYTPAVERVETAEAMRKALESQKWDIVIADYTLPNFSGLDALRLMKDSSFDLPFIIVTGTVTEEMCVAAMKAGAHDYVMKDNLKRLIPAVERELREAKARQQERQTQEQFTKFQTLFHGLVDGMAEGCQIIDFNYHYVYLNDVAVKHSHKTREELLGRTMMEMYPGIEKTEMFAHLKHCMKERIPHRMENLFTFPDGSEKWFELSVEPVPEGIFILSLDITERKRVEEALQHSKEQFRALIENVSDTVIVINANATISYVSPSAEKLLGYKIGEMVGRNAFDFVHTDDVSELTDIFNRGTQISDYTVKLEYRLQHKDGAWRNFEVVAKNLLYNPVVAGIIMTYHDITERKQAEKALRQSEEKYRNLVENAPSGIVVSTLDGRIIEVNEAMIEMYRYNSKEEFMNTPAIERYYDPADRERLLNLATNGMARNFETLRRRKDGTTFWATLTSIPRITESGERQLITVVNDITEHKKAAEALRASEEKLRLMFQSMTEGITVTNLEGKIVEVNEAKVRMHGYKNREELLGRSFIELIAKKDRAAAEEGRRMTVSKSHIGNAERTFVTKDGQEFPGEVSATIIKDASGNPTGVIVVSQDTAERKKAEENLRRAAQEWRTTFDSISDWVSVHDKNLKITRVNKAFAAALQMEPQEIIGKYCYEIIHGAKQPFPGCPHRLTIETGRLQQAEVYEPRVGKYFEVTTSPVINNEGELVATVRIARDITERRKAQEHLILTDRLAAIGELSSGIAHELNNPLTSVIGFSQLLLERDVPADIKEDLITINKEAQRTAQIVKNLLTFARKHESTKQSVNINNVIQKVLEMRAYEHKINNIRVNTQFVSDLPTLIADGFQLQQVFLNIIINAEYFMTEAHGRGTLTITTERSADIARITIVDDGPGISQENLRNLFTPFFTTKEVGRGTGLGLSICHGIVTAHGGKIYAESELDKGATFIVELPLN